MARSVFAFFLLFSLSTAAQAQTDGGGQDGGGGADGGGQNTGGQNTNTGTIDTGGTADTGLAETSIGVQGIQTGPTDAPVNGFQNQTNFGGLEAGQTFQARNFNGGGQTRQIVTGGSSQTQRQVRPTYRLGFVPSASLLARNRQRAVSRFTQITPRVRELSGVSIAPGQNGNVTLRGQATSRYGSLVAAALARLEPGVRRVRNEMTVNSQRGLITRPTTTQRSTAPIPAPSNTSRRATPQPAVPFLSVPFQPSLAPVQVPQIINPRVPSGRPTGTIISPARPVIVPPPVPPGR